MLLGLRLQLPEWTKVGLCVYAQTLNNRFDADHQRSDLFYLASMLRCWRPSSGLTHLASANQPEGAARALKNTFGHKYLKVITSLNFDSK